MEEILPQNGSASSADAEPENTRQIQSTESIKKAFRNKKFIRVLIIASVTFVVCKFFLMPCVIAGASMEPTYYRVGFNFCVITDYTKTPLKRGDVVVASYFDKSFLLKRVIGLPGEYVSFVDGQLYINGEAVKEDYIKYPSDWNIPPRYVRPGNVYLIGDNRSMPMMQHQFGQVPVTALKGYPLW